MQVSSLHRCLNVEVYKKRLQLFNMKQVLFHHDNARQHSVQEVLQKLTELN